MRTFLLLALGFLAFGQTQLTLYSSGPALVEEERSFSLGKKGVVELRGFPRETIWETLTVKGVEVLALRPWEPKTWGLHELLGKEIVVQTAEGAFRGILQALIPEGLVLETPEGVVVVREYVWLRGPGLAPPAQALLFYRQEGERTLRFRYLAYGITWKATYDAEFSQGKFIVLGKAVIQNDTGIEFPNAKITLVAGDIRPPREDTAVRALALAPEVREVFEYHRYDLPGRWDLPQGRVVWPFLAAEFPATKVFRFTGRIVEVLVRFASETSLPSGEVRVYADGVFAGADTIRYTPAGTTVELALGAAFDLTGERVQLKREKIAENVFRETWRIILRSGKPDQVIVEAIETLSGYWRVISSTLPYEILDAQRIKFAVPVDGFSEATVEYTVEWWY